MSSGTHPNGRPELLRIGSEIHFSIPATCLAEEGTERIEAVLRTDETHALRENRPGDKFAWAAIWRAQKDGTSWICVAWHQPGFHNGASAYIRETEIGDEKHPRWTRGNAERASELFGKPKELSFPVRE